MTQPASVPADGNLKVVWVSALADPANPTATELNAGSVVDLSCYLSADGYSPSTDEQSVTDDRLCSRQTYEQPGRFAEGLEVGYVYRQQDPLATDNKAFATLKHLTAGYVATRWGQDYEDAFAATDIVDIYPATCGRQRKQKPTANGVLTIMQKLFITGAVQQDVAVA